MIDVSRPLSAGMPVWPGGRPFHLDAHHRLTDLGMTWIEGLWLGGVEAGLYELLALPLALVGAEAAPLRAILRRLGT